MNRLRVGLLANPAAADGAAHRIGRHVGHLLRLAGISVVDLSGPSASVARARAHDVRDTLTALVVVGGDGTVSLGAEIVANTPVRLGIVPAGSGNDLAGSLGIPAGDPDAATRILLHALSRPAQAIDALELSSTDDAPFPQRSIALGNVSLGFDALVNARANSGGSGGGLRYSLAALWELPSFAPFPYWIEVDGGGREELDASVLTLCNSGRLGGGMKLSPRSRADDGRLEIVTVQGLGRAGLLRFLPRVFRGTHTSIPEFSIRTAQAVTVGLRHGRAIRAYADGEPRSVLPISVRVLPAAVRVLADLEGAP